MSPLHKPTPGEILDRLTILQLKLVYGKLAGRDCTHWVEEYEALADQLWSTAPGSGPVRVRGAQWMELAATNAALWQAEDELRRYRTEGLRDRDGVAFHAAVGRCAMQIQQLNDRRAELVTQINTAAGVVRPEEKL